jgi:hypothetical protein
MITMTNEQLEKIDLLDKLFGAISIEQLRQFTESEQVVAILKGTNHNSGLLRRLVQEHDILAMEVLNMKADLVVFKYDFQNIIKAIDKPYDSINISNFQVLKNKHGIY